MHSSRTPRRAFAAPLVMTIAAAVPACMVASKPPSNQPEPHVRDHRDGADTKTVTHTNPPRPDAVDHTQTTPEQAPPDYERKWTVTLASDGTCAAMGEVSCPANATCNPPPPMPVACPTGITADRPVQIWANAGESECYVTLAAAKCPAKATCNPPPPQKTACPQ